MIFNDLYEHGVHIQKDIKSIFKDSSIIIVKHVLMK